MNNTTKNLLEAVFVAGLLVAGISIRARAADVPQVHVNYAGLDITQPTGAAVLYQRIRVAAAQVCGTPDPRDLVRVERARTCTHQAIADAVAAVGNDTLTAVERSKTHGVAVATLASN